MQLERRRSSIAKYFLLVSFVPLFTNTTFSQNNTKSLVTKKPKLFPIETKKRTTCSIDEMESSKENPPGIDCYSFYKNYFGHPPELLESLIQHKPSNQSTIYLVGDSTLDNKYWIPERTEPHPNMYIRSRLISEGNKCILHRDIAYWLSKQIGGCTVMNCAVEQTMLRTRCRGDLFPQDILVRENINENDILVVSIGGNDVGLSPQIGTAFSILMNVLFSGNLGMSSLINLFKTQMQEYIHELVQKSNPKLIVICMVYFLDEDYSKNSWANTILKILGYNSSPQRLQNTMRKVYEQAVCNIQIDGCRVVYAPLFEALDGKNTNLYVDRVEPSEEGGQVLASFIQQIIDDGLSETS